MKAGSRQSSNYLAMAHRFPYKWYLSDGYPANGMRSNGLKVFGTFVCGGGSTMGYKLAGFDHLGGVELDKKVADIYELNHHPKYLYVEDIRDFNERTDLPDELYNLDILDGSPPCSTFSTAGARENAWGKKKQFREGQKEQRLDDLVFVYCETIKKLHPKTFILENVSGLLKGAAKAYVARVIKTCNENGYDVQCFLLSAASMGVPQRRERTFLIGRRKDLHLPELKLHFNEESIPFGRIQIKDYGAPIKGEVLRKLWDNRRRGDINQSKANERLFGKPANFGQSYCYTDKVAPTLTAKGFCLVHFDFPTFLGRDEIMQISSFPLDYEDKGLFNFLCGMSVPPLMIAQIAHQMDIQWFK